MAIVNSGNDNLNAALMCEWKSEKGTTVFKELIKELPSE